MRPPMEITFALLCSRASFAVSIDQTKAALTPLTLLAAICSPLPEPPKTIQKAAGSAAVAFAAGMQKTG